MKCGNHQLQVSLSVAVNADMSWEAYVAIGPQATIYIVVMCFHHNLRLYRQFQASKQCYALQIPVPFAWVMMITNLNLLLHPEKGNSWIAVVCCV